MITMLDQKTSLLFTAKDVDRAQRLLATNYIFFPVVTTERLVVLLPPQLYCSLVFCLSKVCHISCKVTSDQVPQFVSCNAQG